MNLSTLKMEIGESPHSKLLKLRERGEYPLHRDIQFDFLIHISIIFKCPGKG